MITVANSTSLLDRLQRTLRGSPFSAEFDRVEIAERGGTVYLTGTVSSYYHKQRAIEACRHVPGLAMCSDGLTVHYPDENS